MTNILIAGCGYVGTELAVRLRDAGHTVWCIRRSIEKLPEGVEALQGDLSDLDAIPALPEQLDYVIYSAGAGGFEEAKYRAAYVEGPKNVAAALEKGGVEPKRFVFTSSTGVYHQTGGVWVDESSTTAPESFSGTVLLEGERYVLGRPFDSYVARFGGIYGPGRDRLIRSVRGGTVSMPEDASYINLIHRNDCARVLQHLLFSDAAPGIYNAVDDQPVDRRELYAWIAEQLGVEVPQASGKPDATMRQSRSNKRCQNSKLKETDFEFDFPTYREGLAKLLES